MEMWSAVFLFQFVEKMRNPCVKDMYKAKKGGIRLC